MSAASNRLMSKKTLVPMTVLVALAIVTAVGCRGFFVNPQLTSIAITPNNPSITPNSTLQLTATGTNNDGSTSSRLPSLTWTTSDQGIATVSATGLVKAVAVGTATITATSGVISGTDSITVSNNVNSLTISPQNPSVSRASQTQATFTASSNGSDVTNSASWSSSNTAVATLSSPGVFTIVGQGTTTITATFTPSGGSQQTASTLLTVGP